MWLFLSLDSLLHRIQRTHQFFVPFQAFISLFLAYLEENKLRRILTGRKFRCTWGYFPPLPDVAYLIQQSAKHLLVSYRYDKVHGELQTCFSPACTYTQHLSLKATITHCLPTKHFLSLKIKLLSLLSCLVNPQSLLSRLY